MPAMVLCDGGQSSLRAIEVAGYPGGVFMCQHDGTQLVIVHAWSKKPATSQAASSATAAAASAASAGATTQAHARPASSGAAPDAAAVAAEAEPASSAHAASPDVPTVQVLASVLRTIKESKPLRDTLLYKLEAAALPFVTSIGEEESDAAAAGKRVDSPRKPTLSPARGAKKKDPLAGGGGGGGANSPLASSPLTPAKTPEELAEAQHQAHEAAQRAKSAAIVDYVAGRLVHHGCRTVVLGAGNALDGKIVTVGYTARAALAAWRAAHVLCFVKPDGFVPRRAAATARLLVVVPVCGVALDKAPHAATSACPSAVADKGKDKAGLFEASLDAGRAVVRFALRTASAVADASTKGLAASKAGAESATTADDRVLPGAGAASSSTLRVGVVVVVTPGTEAAVVERFQRAFESQLSSYAEAAPTVLSTTTTTTTTTSVAAPAATAAEDGSSDAAEESWAPVTVLTLKSSKQVKEPTIDNSAAQVSRFAQQVRAEYALVADNVPEALHEALLSASKPHCVVVPHVHY